MNDVLVPCATYVKLPRLHPLQVWFLDATRCVRTRRERGRARAARTLALPGAWFACREPLPGVRNRIGRTGSADPPSPSHTAAAPDALSYRHPCCRRSMVVLGSLRRHVVKIACKNGRRAFGAKWLCWRLV